MMWVFGGIHAPGPVNSMRGSKNYMATIQNPITLPLA